MKNSAKWTQTEVNLNSELMFPQIVFTGGLSIISKTHTTKLEIFYLNIQVEYLVSSSVWPIWDQLVTYLTLLNHGQGLKSS